MYEAVCGRDPVAEACNDVLRSGVAVAKFGSPGQFLTVTALCRIGSMVEVRFENQYEFHQESYFAWEWLPCGRAPTEWSTPDHPIASTAWATIDNLRDDRPTVTCDWPVAEARQSLSKRGLRRGDVLFLCVSSDLTATVVLHEVKSWSGKRSGSRCSEPWRIQSFTAAMLEKDFQKFNGVTWALHMAGGVLLGSKPSPIDLYGSAFSCSPDFWRLALTGREAVEAPTMDAPRSWFDKWASAYIAAQDSSPYKQQRVVVADGIRRNSRSACVNISAAPGTGKTTSIMSILVSVAETARSSGASCKCLIIAHSNQATQNSLKRLADVAGPEYCSGTTDQQKSTASKGAVRYEQGTHGRIREGPWPSRASSAWLRPGPYGCALGRNVDVKTM